MDSKVDVCFVVKPQKKFKMKDYRIHYSNIKINQRT